MSKGCDGILSSLTDKMDKETIDKLPDTINTDWVVDKAYNLKNKDTNVFGGWQSFDEEQQFQFA